MTNSPTRYQSSELFSEAQIRAMRVNPALANDFAGQIVQASGAVGARAEAIRSAAERITQSTQTA